jgi:RNA polymerase sigma-70 factor, ECF subfamily
MIAMNTHSDKSLINRVRKGDEIAATELYQRYASRVFGLVHTQMAEHLKAQLEPEDIVQSVFKSIFRGMSAGNYDAPDGGTLWKLIAVIAVNKVRRNASRRMASKRDSRRTESLVGLEAAFMSSPDSTQVMELAIRESIDSLKPAEQQVVTLRVQGFTVEEIAERCKLSKRTIERLLQHARQSLAEMLFPSDE